VRSLTLAAAALFAVAAHADDPKLPASAMPPATVYARAAADGGKVTVTLKLMEIAPTTETRTVPATETRTVDGKVVSVQVTRQVTITVNKPVRWRTVTFDAAAKGVSIQDAAGKAVAAGQLPRLLEKDTPVLVSSNGPVDPFFLATAKESALVFVVPPETFFVAAPSGTSPGTPIPSPPKK
jgi:hypothetical protein